MNVDMDPDLKRVAEFMQSSIPAAKLQGVAAALARIAPSLWGRYGDEQIIAIALREPPPIPDYDQPKRLGANE